MHGLGVGYEQLAMVSQILKDLVGIDIADIITGRVTGNAIGEAISASPTAPGKRAAAPKADPKV